MRKKFDFFDCSNPSDWDNELLEYGCPHVYQSSAFAEQYPDLTGSSKYHPRYLYISDSGVVIGQCLIGVSKRKTVQWLYGPVVKDSHLDCYDSIVMQMMGDLQKQGILGVDFASTQVFYDKKIYSENPKSYSYIGETCFVDLERNIEDIFKSFDRSVRKNIRKCKDAGVTVEITNDISIVPLYLEMLSNFRKRFGFQLPPFHPDASSMTLFSRENTSMDIALARADGLPVAAMGYVTFGKLVTEIAAAESEDYRRLKLPANDFIKVKAIETYKSRGIKYYDITGGMKFTKDPKEQGINKFKRKFGKQLAEFQCINQKYIQANSLAHNVHVGILKARRRFNKYTNVRSGILKARRMFNKFLNVR